MYWVGGVLLLVSLVWDGFFVCVCGCAPSFWTSAFFKVLQGLKVCAPPTPLASHQAMRMRPSQEEKPEAHKNKKTRCPGTRHQVVSWTLPHTHTHTRARCTVYNTQPHSWQIKTVKKHFIKAQHGILKLIAHVETSWLEP